MLIGYAMCASFCTVKESLKQMEKLKSLGHDILPIMSEALYTTDTRFAPADEVIREVMRISARERVVHSIREAEPLGPAVPLDMLVVAPCTGNTLAKVANGITDSAVTMAIKAHLRSDRPLVVALASNDALSQNLKNVGSLLTRRGVYFVPMHQDDPDRKPHSLVADFSRLCDAVDLARKGRQSRPLFLCEEQT